MRRPRAPVTHGIAGLCAMVYLGLALTGSLGTAAALAGFYPVGWPLGGAAGHGVVPALLSPVTAALLHADVLHLLFNMLILIFIGRPLELMLGGRGLLLLLLAGVYGAALAEVLAGALAIGPGSRLVIGANGGVSAAIAAYALSFSRSPVRAVGPLSADLVRALWLAAAWTGLQFLLAFAGGVFGGIAIYSHIGGFLTGLCVARPLLRWRVSSIR